MRRHLSSWILASGMIAICGCQSWSQIGQAVPGGSRVPPPGTGTYNVPSSYYNNGAGAKSGALSSTDSAPSATGGQVRTASAQALPSTNQQPAANSEVATANWQIPTVDQVRSGVNNSAATALNNVSSRANQAVQSGTSRAAAAVDKYTNPLLGAVQQPANPASQSLSDSSPTPTTGNSLPGASAAASRPADEPQLDWQPPQ